VTLSIEALDATRWDDLCTLFGPAGASSGCWCMFWRLPAKEWSAGTGSAARDPVHGNKMKFDNVVRAGGPIGLLAYVDGVPAGWCAVAPRPAYPRVFSSPTLAPANPDEPGVWSVTCFFVDRKHRRAGLANALLDAAVDWAAEQGATAVEGYPVEPRDVRGHAGDFFTGTVSQFEQAGFAVQPRPKHGRRAVMRRSV
jgi:GNAT superfamily N-acetyltransferase